MLNSIANLITNEYISILKIRYTKLRDWINVFTLLYEVTLKQLMIDKKIVDKEAQEIKKTYNLYRDKRNEIMINTSFKVEDVFVDKFSKDSISPEEITKLNNFSAKKM